MTEWQDIETAPRPDRDHPFLAYHKGGYWALVFWSTKANCYATYWDGDPIPQAHPATHWMPLPDPPSPA